MVAYFQINRTKVSNQCVKPHNSFENICLDNAKYCRSQTTVLTTSKEYRFEIGFSNIYKLEIKEILMYSIRDQSILHLLSKNENVQC